MTCQFFRVKKLSGHYQGHGSPPQKLAVINSNVSEFVWELVEPFTQQEVSGAVTAHPLRDTAIHTDSLWFSYNCVCEVYWKTACGTPY